MKTTGRVALTALVTSFTAAAWMGCGGDETTNPATPDTTPDASINNVDATPPPSQPPVQKDAGPSCATGQIVCGSSCVDPQLDREHCGDCATACGPSEVCSQGKCGLTCGGGTTKCGDNCVDTKVDPKNCGACGAACGAGQICEGGPDGGAPACVCANGMTNCNGACVDLQTDDAHCGTCAMTCTGGKVCAAGTCKGVVSEWRFEDSLDDETATNNGTADGTITYADLSWSASHGKAVVFDNSNSVVVATPTGLPMGTTPRTIEAWIRPTGASNGTYNGILSYGLRQAGNGQLLSWQNNWRLSSANWSNDLLQTSGSGAQPGVWNHVAFTWDGATRKLWIDGAEVASDAPAPFDTMDGALRIGATDDPAGRRFVGQVDDVKVFDYARTAAQLRADANQDIEYLFAAGADMTDSGPNKVSTGTKSATGVTNTTGHAGGISALAFDGATDSYVSIYPAWAIGRANYGYTIMMWVKPATDPPAGTLLQVSSAADGGGWCLPMLAIDDGGHPIAISWLGPGTYAMADDPVAVDTWVHVAQTWSPNALRLYVNGKLVKSTVQTTFGASGAADYLTLASARQGTSCYGGPLNAAGRVPFNGAIDDFKVFDRALSDAEIAAAAK